MSEDTNKTVVAELLVQPIKEDYGQEGGLSVDWTREEEAKAKRK